MMRYEGSFQTLNSIAGVESVDIDLPTNKVVVKGDVEPQVVYNTAAKTGKKTEFWS